MIIRMTVKNNDYTRVLESYLLRFWINIMEIEDLTIDNSIKHYHLSKKINNLLNPNMNSSLANEDKQFIIQQIKSSFSYWSAKHTSNSNYLMSCLEVDIQNTLEDKWENGEVVYWFQHSNSTITQ